ncbi:MAG TPA: helix-turn-helix transcriptional regulator [Allosphingosinicella sp.]|nr:helix-turn-helix transcriptional regulator [Allosphingosinicella sp.]
MSFGARLAEERRRLGFKQSEFAQRVGSDAPKQSLYEHDHRQLRAAYLSRIAAAGVDVAYVLTGRRSEGEWLDQQTTEFLSAFLSLPPELQSALARLLDDLGRLNRDEGKV